MANSNVYFETYAYLLYSLKHMLVNA